MNAGAKVNIFFYVHARERHLFDDRGYFLTTKTEKMLKNSRPSERWPYNVLQKYQF